MIDTSIIITNYNHDKYLGRCLRSCLKQSIDKGRYEIIVVDDASTDDSRNIIKEFEDRITTTYLGSNVGVAEASNIGIKKAMGAFVMRVDSDDYINENTILFMTEILLANPDIGFVYSDLLLITDAEDILGRIELDTVDKIKKHGAGIMFRKSNMEAIGLYDKELRNAEDYDLITRYFKNFNGYHLRLPLYRYRQVEGSLSKQDRKGWEAKSNKKYE